MATRGLGLTIFGSFIHGAVFFGLYDSYKSHSTLMVPKEYLSDDQELASRSEKLSLLNSLLIAHIANNLAYVLT